MFGFGSSLGTINWSASGTPSLEIPKGKLWRRLGLRLQTTFAVAAAANNTASGLALGDEWSLLPRVELRFGTQNIVTVAGYQLWQDCLTFSKYRPQVTPELGDATTTSKAIDSLLFIDFEATDMKDSKASLLDTSRLDIQQTSLNLTWANAGTVLHASNTTALSASNTTVTVYGDEFIPPNATGWGRTYHPQRNPFGYGAPFLLPLLTSGQQDFAAALQGDQRMDLPNDGWIKYLAFECQASGGGAQEAGVISQFKLIADDRPRLDFPEETVRQLAYHDRKYPNGYERALNSGTGGFGRLMQSTKYDQRANYLVDFTSDGWWKGMYNAYPISKLQFAPTTTGASRINYVCRRYRDPKLDAAA